MAGEMDGIPDGVEVVDATAFVEAHMKRCLEIMNRAVGEIADMTNQIAETGERAELLIAALYANAGSVMGMGRWMAYQINGHTPSPSDIALIDRVAQRMVFLANIEAAKQEEDVLSSAGVEPAADLARLMKGAPL